MGYAKGKRWNNELIKEGIELVMYKAGIETMPTVSVTKKVLGNSSLSNAISKNGGFNYWAARLNLEQLGCETSLGKDYETYCLMFIQNELDLNVKQMSYKYPYDLLVENNIKIDVKVGKLYMNKGSMYTFNLEKRAPTCDVFVAYCIDDNKDIIKTYVIPSSIMSGKTQLSVGINRSKYDIYLDNWNLVYTYNKFYNKLKKGRVISDFN